jgi:hypothetical protein
MVSGTLAMGSVAVGPTVAQDSGLATIAPHSAQATWACVSINLAQREDSDESLFRKERDGGGSRVAAVRMRRQ